MKSASLSKKKPPRSVRPHRAAVRHHRDFSVASRVTEAFNTLKANVVNMPFLSRRMPSGHKRVKRAKHLGMPRHGNFHGISHFSEAFNTLRTNIRFARLDGPVRALLITGAAPREGKTTVAVNLAESFALAGQKTLLIEGDLRLGTFKNIFRTDKGKGLSTLLSETLDTPLEKGLLGRISLGDLITLVGLKEETGTLTITRNSDSYQFSFEMGKLVSSAWRKRPSDKHLVTTLIRSGLLTVKQAKEAIMRARQTGQRLSFILLNMRVINPDQLRGPIRLEIMDTLGHALNVGQAQYSFRQMSHVPYEREFMEPISLGDGLADELPGLRMRPFLRNQLAASIIETDTKRFHILPGGPRPPNPSEVLGSRCMAVVMDMLKDMFDYDILIIDSPPITSVSDAAILSVFADAVIMVACAGTINQTMIRKAVDQLNQINAPFLGFVLNRMDPKEERRYYNYYYRYRYHDYYYTGKRRRKEKADA